MKRIIVILLSAFLLLSGGSVSWARMASIKRDDVRVRSGPGTAYGILYEVFAGFPVKVLRTKRGWARVIDFEGDIGWVYWPLLSKVRTVIVSKSPDKVNVRSGPGLKFKVKAKTEYGVVFRFLKRRGNWVKIKHADGLVGWIHRRLVWGE